MISPRQAKGARAMLDMSRSDLANAAGIAERTLVDFERGARTPHANNLAAIKRALEDAGVVLIGDDMVGLRKSAAEDSHFEAAVFRALEQDPQVQTVVRAPVLECYRPDGLIFFVDGTVGIAEVKGSPISTRDPATQLLEYAKALNLPNTRLLLIVGDNVIQHKADPRIEALKLDGGRLIPA